MMSSTSTIWKKMIRRKPLEPPAESQLKRTLNSVDLILYGVGSSVGAGIYCLVGIGADIAGPAITVSFFCCGLSCILTALPYAEFAARIPVTGSAYVYAYTTFGEVWGWLVGWNLTLGYLFAASVVARSWGEYLAASLIALAQQYSNSSSLEEKLVYLTKFPIFGYTCSPLSVLIIAFSTWILKRGAKESTNFNNVMTCFNIGVLVVVILAGMPYVRLDNLEPFFPTGVAGVSRGAGLVFFAFIGFDMVASLSEEVVDPERNMPIGIVGSLVISAGIYICISLVVVGISPIALLGGDTPVTNALLANGCCSHDQQLAKDAAAVCLNSGCPNGAMNPVLAYCSRFVGVGAIFALTAACFVGLMGQPRIFYSMAKDGLFFPIFGEIDPETHVPTAGIVFSGILASLLACFVDLEVLANVISLGTLLVFTFVDASVTILRLRPWHAREILSEKVFVLRTPEFAPTPTRFVAKTSSTKTISNRVYNWRKPWKSGRVKDNGNVPLCFILLFTVSVLFMSLGIRDSWNMVFIILFASLAILSSLLLLSLPRSKPPETFQCPLVPLVPLLGMASNLYMAGALPNLAWVCNILWLCLGLMFYLVYGIHNSTLDKTEEEGQPLLQASGVHYNAIPSGATLEFPPDIPHVNSAPQL